jgi:hypothetical protein
MKSTSIVLAALALSACAPAAIPVPTELSAAPKMEVSGRQGWRVGQRVRFGPYGTERVRRSPTVIEEYPGLVSTRGEHSQYYSFRLTEDGAVVARVGCVAEATARAGRVPVIGEVTSLSRASLQCSLSPSEATSTADDEWTLLVETRNDRPLEGTLSGEAGRFEVEGTSRIEGGASACCNTSGYYLRRDGRPVGAVEVINQGAVWLETGLSGEERRMLAGAAMALLLHEALGEDYTTEP